MAYNKSNEFSKKTRVLAEYAKALSHPARIAILNVLAERNSCICGEIVQILPLAQSTVSQHLHELKKAGLITGEIDGPRSCYCINKKNFEEMKQLFAGFTLAIGNEGADGDKIPACCTGK
jgi:DNA-binding transcriptional ArsR family regulator